MDFARHFVATKQHKLYFYTAYMCTYLLDVFHVSYTCQDLGTVLKQISISLPLTANVLVNREKQARKGDVF